MLYEVEVRNLLKPKDYRALQKYFQKQAKLIRNTKEETIRFATGRGDLRLQISEQGVQLVYKEGALNQAVRPEMTVELGDNDANELQYIMDGLNFPIEMRWIKKRKIYRWQGTTVYLDNAKGHFLWIEVEKLVDSRLKRAAKQEVQRKLEGLLKKLNIPVSSKKEMDRHMNDYKNNWQQAIKKNFIRV